MLKSQSLYLYFFCFSIIFSNQIFGQEEYYNKIVINEFMASNTGFIADPHGEYDDWVEIYNQGSNAVNLEGFFLTDKRSIPTKFEFPSTILASNAYLIVWLDGDLTQSGLHADFKLNSDGDKLYLMDADTTVIDHIRFKNAITDKSIGRYPNGIGVKREMDPSFNGGNVAFSNYGLVINELMALNNAGPQDENLEYDDFVEFYNNSDNSINLNGYFLTNKSSNADKYKISTDINIAAGAYQIIWLDNQDLQGEQHANFNLEGSGDDLMICNVDTTTVDYIRFGDQLENGTFGRWPNGTGGFQELNSTFNGQNTDGIGLNEWELNTISLKQNPVQESLVLIHDYKQNISFRIYDLKGVMVHSFMLSGATDIVEINIATLKDGMYYLKGDGTALIQFVKGH